MLIGNDLWIKTWADAYKTAKDALLMFALVRPDSMPESRGTVNLTFYIGIYGLIGLGSILVLLVRILVIASASLRASRSLHSQLTEKILRAPIKFFERTPMGRLVNRFSKDMKDIDMEVAQFSSDFLANAVKVSSLLGVIMIVTPASLIALAPLVIIYYFVGVRYLFAARELKRMGKAFLVNL